uniref:Family with sequence similarity 91 member A1 n=2 Tax=Eptatretus burgeri TaxID=7764 RepID=A0A8C4R029_EPTBU
MNVDVEFHIRHNYAWTKLPGNVKQSLGNSQREYERMVVSYSIRNQLRYRNNLVRHIKKDERRYYEDLLRYSREHLLLYPYHLSDIIVKGLRVSPFAYYTSMMEDIMSNERSYDSLPNFTAADCLRLLGIGRNQYIDLMNQCRSSKKFFRRRPVRELLPAKAVEVTIEPWWVVQASFITEDDVKICSNPEKAAIDKIIDTGPQLAGSLDYNVVHRLYSRGFFFLDVPISDDDCIVVPPLEGFVMNRLQGDYFETLLYKIFVSIDEHTNVMELANVLEIELSLVKNAVSLYCRLGIAHKKGNQLNVESLHLSWMDAPLVNRLKSAMDPQKMLLGWEGDASHSASDADTASQEELDSSSVNSLPLAGSLSTVMHTKRIAFLFDSTLTAFLMMGNLSPNLKSHAVTMFEVGKLSDESLDSFLLELEKVNTTGEGEAQRYFDHALTLRNTILFLRHNPDLAPDPDAHPGGLALDLLRSESLLGLDPGTCSRVLNKNYALLVSMAPLSNEIRPVSSCTPQHVGPAIPEVSSIWFKLYVYHITGQGPPSLLLSKGTRLRKLPTMFQGYERLLITSWGHDPGVVSTSNVLMTLNDALTHSAVLVQANGTLIDGDVVYIPFPFDDTEEHLEFSRENMASHPAIRALRAHLDLSHACGFVELVSPLGRAQKSRDIDRDISSVISGFESPADSGSADSFEMVVPEIESTDRNSPYRASDICTPKVPSRDPAPVCPEDWVPLEVCFGIPLFDAELNRRVCEKVARHKLCRKERLDKLLHTSRKLSLQLLDFIVRLQDPSFFASGTAVAPSIPALGEHGVPLPAVNLAFIDGRLSPWQGKLLHSVDLPAHMDHLTIPEP